MHPTNGLSLKQFSRLAGLFYLAVIATGIFAEVLVRQALIVPQDPLATYKNIQASESLYRIGFFADLVNFLCGLPAILFFYVVLKPLYPRIVLLAIFFVIIGNAVFAINILHQLEPLIMLGSKEYNLVFSKEQLAALSTISLETQSQGYAIGLVFFGMYCMLIGYSLHKTIILPKVLAVLYIIAGACYIINSCVMFLSHNFHNPLFPYILFPCFIGETAISLWLVFRGVRNPSIQ